MTKEGFIEVTNKGLIAIIEREKFLINQALIFIGVEFFVLINDTLLSPDNAYNLIAVLLLKISAVLFVASIVGGTFLIWRLNNAQAQTVSLEYEESHKTYDLLIKDIKFAGKAIKVVGNLWCLGLQILYP